MNFENETPYEVAAGRGTLPYRHLMQATVVVKATYDVGESGQVTLAEAQQPVAREDVDLETVCLEAELGPVKAGCDVLVFAAARAPGGKPVTTMATSFRIGSWQRTLHVTGDRHWELGPGGRLRIGAPAPFVTMPLTYDLAYGGEAAVGEGGLTVPWSPNGNGIGFVLAEEDVPGTPLPNIEEPDQLIAKWDDHPLVAGVAPLARSCSLRVLRGLSLDKETGIARVHPAFWSAAHPRMMLEHYPAGQRFQIEGVADTPWTALLPPFEPHVRVDLGGASYELPIVADTIYAWPADNKLVVAGRCSFIYELKPRRLRTMRVICAASGRTLPAPTCVRAERVRGEPLVPLELDVDPKMAPLLPLVPIEHNPMHPIIDELPLCPSG